MRLFLLFFVLFSFVSAFCPPGTKYRTGSFYKECTHNRELIRAGCFADWLWGEAAFVPFGTSVDHLLHEDMGYRFSCETNGRSHSFQITACLYRKENGEIGVLEKGESAFVRGRNGRNVRFICRS